MKRTSSLFRILLAGSMGTYATVGAAQNSGGPAALVTVPGTLSAGGPGATPAWGTVSLSALSLVAQAFQPLASESTYTYGFVAGNLALLRTGTLGVYEAPVALPSGALIQSVEFRFCDSSGSSYFASYLTVNDKTGDGSMTQTPLVQTTPEEVPGCVIRAFTPASPIEVDNGDRAYSLEVYLGGGGPEIALLQARVYYSLQVSPAPATATFPNDVPTTHQFFRYVEALAASGITVGTGPGTFGVNSPVTRGQMAVFLAKALGLHFPN